MMENVIAAKNYKKTHPTFHIPQLRFFPDNQKKAAKKTTMREFKMRDLTVKFYFQKPHFQMWKFPQKWFCADTLLD